MARKKLPLKEKKKVIQIMVKTKHHAKAKKEAAAIARKYNTDEGNGGLRKTWVGGSEDNPNN